MSSRAPSSYYVRPSQSSPRPYDRNHNRDRDGPRGYDREARDIRSRSRSPKRERSRSRSPKRERYDERGNSPFLLSTLIPLTLPTIFPLACTERGYDRSREFAPPARGDYRGGRGRDYGSERYDSRRRHEERNDRDRPLDRRAIEEGRRRREEERAKGIVAEEPKAVPTGPRRGVTAQREDQGSASPYPESVSRGEDGEVAHHRRNGDDAREDGMGDEGEGVRDGVGDEEEGFASMMGFGGFGTTKGKGIGTNAGGAVKVHKQRTWRQYMNRRGGFNRPLEKMK